MSGPRDPFRTLDDPDPKPDPPMFVTAGQLNAEHIAAAGAPIMPAGLVAPEWFVVGGLRIPLKRPAWWRRAIVRVVLGWKWDK